MEDLGLRALYRRVAGIDVHRMLHVVTVLLAQPDGSMQRQTRQFGGFRRDCRELAAWLAELRIELVVMESTGIYWKSVYAHLENAGVPAWVVVVGAEVALPFGVTIRLRDGGFDQAPKTGRGLRC